MLNIIDFNIPINAMFSKIRFKLSFITRDNHYIKITPEIILKLLLDQYTSSIISKLPLKIYAIQLKD